MMETQKKNVASGCTDFNALCQQMDAGIGCGSCRSEIKVILGNALKLELVRV
jgi:ferredoxin-nitrate reductase